MCIRDRSEIEDNLKKTFGVTNIIWLKHGTDEGTDGHIDNVACFSAPGTVIAMTCNDKHDPYYDRLNENLEVLKTSTDSSGNRLKIIELEMSYKRIIPKDDEPCSYINFYIANNAIVLPIFNEKKIKCPVLVIGAKQDRVTPISIARQVARKIAHVSDYIEYPKFGHWLMSGYEFEVVSSDCL